MMRYTITDEETGEEIIGTAETILFCGSGETDTDVIFKGMERHAHDIADAIVEVALDRGSRAMRMILSKTSAAVLPGGKDSQNAKFISLLLDDLKEMASEMGLEAEE